MHPVVRYARLSRAAYWDDLDAIKAELALLGLTFVGFRSDAGTDTQVLAARDAETLVFAFRGSSSVRDFLRDATVTLGFFLGTRLHSTETHVHRGFRDGWAAVRNWCDAVVVAERAQGAFMRVVTTGHSLGGALATLAAADIWLGMTSSYTYGSPRVGAPDFANPYDSANIDTVRVVHDEDIVPRVPEVPYRHVQGELRLLDDGSVVGPVKTWWRGLFDWNKHIVADLDGEAFRDHGVDKYLAACEAYAKGQSVAA